MLPRIDKWSCILITWGVTWRFSKHLLVKLSDLLTFHHFPFLFLSFSLPLSLQLGSWSPVFHPFLIGVFCLPTSQNVLERPAVLASPGSVRDSDSQAIPDLENQSLHFNKIPMQSKHSLKFEKHGAGACLPDTPRPHPASGS